MTFTAVICDLTGLASNFVTAILTILSSGKQLIYAWAVYYKIDRHGNFSLNMSRGTKVISSALCEIKPNVRFIGFEVVILFDLKKISNKKKSS